MLIWKRAQFISNATAHSCGLIKICAIFATLSGVELYGKRPFGVQGAKLGG
jgi:hypothetical protein